MPVRRHDSRGWPDFTATAWRQSLALPRGVQFELESIFPEFVSHPTRPSPTIDVVPIRNDALRWRLKVPGYRVVFQVSHGRPLVEEIEPRAGHTYSRFGRYSSSRSK